VRLELAVERGVILDVGRHARLARLGDIGSGCHRPALRDHGHLVQRASPKNTMNTWRLM
jgi:hypothetical protein